MEKGADEEHGDRCGILLVAHLYDGNVQVAGTESEQKRYSRLARLTGGKEGGGGDKLRVRLIKRIESFLRLVSPPPTILLAVNFYPF